MWHVWRKKRNSGRVLLGRPAGRARLKKCRRIIRWVEILWGGFIWLRRISEYGELLLKL